MWLTEWLCESMKLKSGMRVLDLGCGKALSSIFLAREFDVRVWAADLWVNPDRNWKRVKDSGVSDLVSPLQVEAHSLPFPAEFFDAVISVDAYQYFGTDVLYLGYLSRFVKPGGKIGIAVPGLMSSIKNGVPEHLLKEQSNGQPFWEDGCASFLTPADWHALWERSNVIEISSVDTLEDGWRYWHDFEVELEKAGKNRFPSVAEALDWDAGQYLGFMRMAGTVKNLEPSLNLYTPSLLCQLHHADQDD
ncbi:MAG: methyltransferase domain-containing protein [Actinobacteria bacterium]|nr:methyltransferase domain-containing protein [Actinomycetota bacterium]